MDKEEEQIRLGKRVLRLSVIELEILRFLNEFGFCEIRQIVKQFDMKKSSAYRYAKKLIQHGLIVNARIIKYQPCAYFVTAKGINLLKFDLPLIKNIPLHIYEHQLDVIDVSITLRKKYPDAIWMSERRLTREKHNNHEHLPDGAVVLPDCKPFAIEIERTLKTKTRLESIILNYGLQNTYKEVWYFCSTSVMPAVTKFAANMPYIKVFRLGDFIS